MTFTVFPALDRIGILETRKLHDLEHMLPIAACQAP